MKKEKVLKDLYYGKICPFEKPDTLIADFRTELLASEKEFEKDLNEIQKSQFSNLIDSYISLFSLELEQEFTNGLKLGAKMMCEILGDT